MRTRSVVATSKKLYISFYQAFILQSSTLVVPRVDKAAFEATSRTWPNSSQPHASANVCRRLHNLRDMSWCSRTFRYLPSIKIFVYWHIPTIFIRYGCSKNVMVSMMSFDNVLMRLTWTMSLPRSDDQRSVTGIPWSGQHPESRERVKEKVCEWKSLALFSFSMEADDAPLPQEK